MAKFKLTKKNLRPQQAELKLVHPVGGETDAIVYLVGAMSKEFKTAQRAVVKKLGRTVDFDSIEIEQQAKLLAEVYVKCVVGWNEDLAEAIGPFCEETALSLFLDGDIDWIGAQIATCVNETSNFFRDEPTDLGEVGSTPNV